MSIAIKLSIDRTSPEGRLLKTLNKEGVLSQAFLGRKATLDSSNGRMLLFTVELCDPAFAQALRNLTAHMRGPGLQDLPSWEVLKTKLLATWWEGKVGKTPQRDH